MLKTCLFVQDNVFGIVSLPEAYISEDEGGEAGASGASGKASVPTEINTGQLLKLGWAIYAKYQLEYSRFIHTYQTFIILFIDG